MQINKSCRIIDWLALNKEPCAQEMDLSRCREYVEDIKCAKVHLYIFIQLLMQAYMYFFYNHYDKIRIYMMGNVGGQIVSSARIMSLNKWFFDAVKRTGRST